MQSFGDLFANNRLLAIGVLLAALAVILAVGIALFRLVFGRRLHMSGGRTRQPRLGVVDAFDLDRQRQLVLVRRDNVEHLLMIGGPNDVVIETSIVRAVMATAALGNREKENGVSSPNIALSPPAPQPPAGPTIPIGGPVGVPPGGHVNTIVPEPEPAAPSAMIPAPARIAEPVPPAAQPQPVAISPEPPPPTMAQSTPPLPEAPRPTPPASPAAAARGFPPISQFPRSAPTMPPRPSSAATPRPSPTPPGPSPVPRPPVSRATPLPLGRTPSAAPPSAQGDRVEPNVAIPRPVQETGTPASTMNGTGQSERSNEGLDTGPARKAEAVSTGREPATAAVTPPINAGPPQPSRIEPAKKDQLPGAMPTATAVPPRPQPAQKMQSARMIESLGSLEEEMAKLLGRPVPPPDDRSGG